MCPDCFGLLFRALNSSGFGLVVIVIVIAKAKLVPAKGRGVF